MVNGRLQLRSYDDNQGVRRRVAEVIAETVKFLTKPKESGTSGPVSYDNDFSFDDSDVPF